MNAPATSSWCTVGQRVEVLQTDEGLIGSRYAGRVLEMAKWRVHVEYEVSEREQRTRGGASFITPGSARRRSSRKAQKMCCLATGSRQTC